MDSNAMPAKRKSNRLVDRKVVTLDRGEGTTLTVQLQGCVISSWRVHNIEQLFVPITADYNPCVRFKGGITLNFPNDPPSDMREVYEVARLYQWTEFLSPKTTSSGDVTATFLMKDDLWTRSVWDRPFLFFYRIVLRQRSIICDLRVINPSKDQPIEFKIHLQMNFEVKTVDDWRLTGLGNEIYINKLKELVPYLDYQETDENPFLTYGQTMYRVYQPRLQGTPLYFARRQDECLVRRDGAEPFKEVVKITKTNFPDITIRYPWCIPERNTAPLNAKHFITDAKRDAVCVGTGHINKLKILKPREMFRAVTKIAILPDETLSMNMAELEESALFRKKAPRRSNGLAESDVRRFCQERDPCEPTTGHHNYPTSGTLGFGSWSFNMN